MPRWRTALLCGVGVLAGLDVAVPTLATNSPPTLADLVAGLTLLWCGADLLSGSGARTQGALLCAAGVSWFLPDLAVTGWTVPDRALSSLALLHVPFLVAALLVVPDPGLRDGPDRFAVVAAGVAAATAVTGGWAPALAVTGGLLVVAALRHWHRAGWSWSRAWGGFAAGSLGYGGILLVAPVARAIGPAESWLPTVYAAIVTGAAATVAAVGTQLRATTAVDVGPAALAQVDELVARALRLPGAEVRVLLPDGRWTDVRGRDVPGDTVLHLSAGLGLWLPASATPAPGPEVDALLRDALSRDALVHDALVLAARNVRLRAEAELAVQELARLRGRLVTVEDEERHGLVERLRAGPVAKLAGLAHDLRGAGVPDAVVARVEQTEDDLDRIALGLDPLGESGSLVDALAALAEVSTNPVHLACEPVDVSAGTARALWFACSELLANAAKHAPSATVTVRLTARAGVVTLTVADDGPGGAELSGRGLRGVRDRIAAAGGTVQARSSAHGSVVTVTLVTGRDTWSPVTAPGASTDVPGAHSLVASGGPGRQEE